MEPDTFVVWLLKEARVWTGPAWECVMCGRSHPSVAAWPCCPPTDRGFTYTDFTHESERGFVYELHQGLVGPALDLWDMMGFWNKTFSTWEAQLREALGAYEQYRVEFEREQAETQHLRDAQALVQEAMLACLASNGGKPVTVTELVRGEPKLCGSAMERAGTEGSVRHGVLKLLGSDPDVRQVGNQNGYPIWLLSEELMEQHGFGESKAIDENVLDSVKCDLVKLANTLIQETGKKYWSAKAFRVRFNTQVYEMSLKLKRENPAQMLGLLFAQFRDAFCVAGYWHGVAHWALQEDALEAGTRLHNDQFAKFTGGS